MRKLNKIAILLLCLPLLFLTSCMGAPGLPETMKIFNRYEVTMGTFQLVGGIIIVVVSLIMIGLNKWLDSRNSGGAQKKKK